MSTDQKGLGGKLKRLFIEGESAEGRPAPPEHVAGISPAQPPGGKAPVDAPAQAHAADPFATAGIEPAKLDFPAVFRAAGLAEEELEQVARADQLIKTLPANLPLETKRQILEGTLQTFKVSAAKIRQSIERERRALSAYAGLIRQDSDKRDAEARAKIESLRAEALELERAIEERSRATASVELSCRAQAEQVSRALEFLPEAKVAEKDAK